MAVSIKDVRNSFCDYFKGLEHIIYPSTPIIVKGDPTLMFTNAGMNPFKNYFLGLEVSKDKRVANTQRCLRVSGKHNDLEEVGVDTYHHTMFEMLGNWSFGDYFKKEMIEWSWHYLTKVLELPKDRIYVTLFQGDNDDSSPRSTIGYEEWKKHIDDNRILWYGKKDNFWEMGEVGPCGPCSEIHIDCRSNKEREKVDARELVNLDHPQVIEIWNLVFIQYNRLANRKLKKLPNFHVDTGMGLERLTRVINNQSSNYDTDAFLPLIHELEKYSSKKYYKNEKTDIAFRVIADHIRAISFGICDGEIPSNVKAGYVLRRILRRSLRFAYSFLGLEEPFMYKLFHVVEKQFRDVFPEISSQKEFIEKIIFEEEKKFLKTLVKGIQRFEKHIGQYKGISGEVAFELYDTYGFPIDLTELMARERNLAIDLKEFKKCLAEQKNRSRSAGKIYLSDWEHNQDKIYSDFVGYDFDTAVGKIVMKRNIEQKGGKLLQVVLDKTPFYAESGGQVGDTGVLINENGRSYSIIDTVKENHLTLHCLQGEKIEGEIFTAKVDKKRREATTIHHSATHLLHSALRKVLGEHVVQKGSYVGPDKLRFDFTHFSKMTNDELHEVERIVKEAISNQIPLEEKRDMAFKDALESGAKALFGEKYGDFVRVITFDSKFSNELCGGTHVSNTEKIIIFKIISESSVASGIRRIEALSGQTAIKLLENYHTEYKKIMFHLNEIKSPVSAIEKLKGENKNQKLKIENLENEWVKTRTEQCLNKIKKVGSIDFIHFSENNLEPNLIKNLSMSIRGHLRTIAVISSKINDGVIISIMINDDLVKEKKWSASEWIKKWANEIDGNGGGQPFYAFAKGKNYDGVKTIISNIIAILK